MLLKEVENKMGKHNPNIIRSTIHIKNMVSNSCIKLIKQELEKTRLIDIVNIKLAEAEIEYNNQIINFDGINSILKRNGFELITDNVEILIEQIKVTIIQFIFFGNREDMKLGNFYYLRKKLGYSYSY